MRDDEEVDFCGEGGERWLGGHDRIVDEDVLSIALGVSFGVLGKLWAE